MTNADIEYTNKFQPRSSAIEDVYYNSKTKELFVALNSGYTYRYDAVPDTTYSDFYRSFSKGRFYAKEIKKKFGPGENVGITDRLHIAEYSVPAADMTSVGNSTGNSTHFTVTDTGKVTGYVPKDLTYAEDARVTDEPSEAREQARVYSLDGGPVNLPETRKHVVRFTNGTDKLLERTVKVASVDEAIADVDEIADMLGEEFSIKEVTTYFV